jgi:hypothetical protein
VGLRIRAHAITVMEYVGRLPREYVAKLIALYVGHAVACASECEVFHIVTIRTHVVRSRRQRAYSAGRSFFGARRTRATYC